VPSAYGTSQKTLCRLRAILAEDQAAAMAMSPQQFEMSKSQPWGLWLVWLVSSMTSQGFARGGVQLRFQARRACVRGVTLRKMTRQTKNTQKGKKPANHPNQRKKILIPADRRCDPNAPSKSSKRKLCESHSLPSQQAAECPLSTRETERERAIRSAVGKKVVA
jgi:hypothetical protein